MRDRQTITGFVLTGALLGLLFLVSVILEGSNRDIFIKEGGVVELATVVGYSLCIAMILYKGRIVYLKRYYYFVLVISFIMLKELDFDKRFTTMGLLKSKFYISDTVPLMEKLVGTIVMLLLLFGVVSVLYRHSRDFVSGLKRHSTISIGALITVFLLILSITLDGLGRKLAQLGIEIAAQISRHAEAVEEIGELGIPIILLLTFAAYFERTKPYQSASSSATAARVSRR
jgi:hypothetical protein